ncbi:T9SS type A sorting domain-containing protein [candidate division WOR-3 bacterium]|nr:T9SS type A sorting domain-containing protein [candidate division WOR-3 bacterium]
MRSESEKIIFFTLFVFLISLSSLYSTETMLTEHRTNLQGEDIIVVKKTDSIISEDVNSKNLFNLPDEFELAWDDGEAEAGFFLYFTSNGECVGVKFISPLPAFRLKRARWYIDPFFNANPWARLMVFPDINGQPDTTKPYKMLWWVPQSGTGWKEYDINTTMFDDTFWVAFRWPSGYVYTFGVDSTNPDGMSYSPWVWARRPVPMSEHFTDFDIMIRVVGDSIGVQHDVTSISIIEPFFKWIYPYGTRVLVGDTIVPKAQVGNCGVGSENFDVMYLITDSLGGAVYSNTKPVTLGANNTMVVEFDPWIVLSDGDFTAVVYTNLSGDEYLANDTVKVEIISGEKIIFHDFGMTNVFMCTIGDWATNRKHLVKFPFPSIPRPPFIVKGARIDIHASDADTALEYVSLCVDNNGLPDTVEPLATVYNVTANIPSPNASEKWAEVDFGEIERADTTPLWVVAKYQEGVTDPHMGIDCSKPVAGYSGRYYFRNGTGHWEMDTLYQWIIHLVVKKISTTGVEEIITAGAHKYPSLSFTSNPASRGATMFYDLPRNSKVRLIIYNISGQLVKTLISAEQSSGLHTAIWNGKDDANKNVPTGVYFCRLTNDNLVVTKKLVLLQ